MTFRKVTPEGLSIIEITPGSFEVVADDTLETISQIQAPWDGRDRASPPDLVRGGGRRLLRQKVDRTLDPIVVDPWVSVGWCTSRVRWSYVEISGANLGG